MSARTEIAEKFKEFFADNGLNEVYGVLEGYGTNKRFRYLTFCRARTVDGEINIYGPKFIVLKWQTSYHNVGRETQLKVDSVEKALKFLDTAFVKVKEIDWEEYE